jgi:hypothetical protein
MDKDEERVHRYANSSFHRRLFLLCELWGLVMGLELRGMEAGEGKVCARHGVSGC